MGLCSPNIKLYYIYNGMDKNKKTSSSSRCELSVAKSPKAMQDKTAYKQKLVALRKI